MAAAEVIIQGRVATLAGHDGFAWTEAIAVRDGRVVAAGRAADMEPLVTARADRLRLGDEHVVLPAIIDAHLHLRAAAIASQELDLEPALTLADALALIAAAHAERAATGERTGWILGRGWSPDRWGTWPTATALDDAAPDRPLALWSHDHHTRWISSTAARLARIGHDTPDPPGGIVGRDDSGELTGILYERASVLVDRAIPEMDEGEVERSVVAYAAKLASLGVVGCHDPGDLVTTHGVGRGLELYRRLATEGRLPLRVHASVRAEQLDAAIEQGLRSGEHVAPVQRLGAAGTGGATRFRFGWLKLFADGTLGSRTAALLEPYEVHPGEQVPAGGPAGMLIVPSEELARLTRRAADAGIGTQIHAIGDRAVRVALDALEASRAAALRVMPRVEHIQLLDPADRLRFARARIAASVQPAHLRGEAVQARRAWGKRTANSYPFASLMAAGAVVAFGTDAPVESPDPWPGLAMAVSRHDAAWGDETEPFEAQEALELPQALRAACLGPAIAAGEEDEAGRLVAGCRADFLVLEADQLRGAVTDARALATARPLATFLDGRMVFRSAAFDR